MLFDRQQHVGESAQHVRTNRFALESARRGAADVALGDGHAKMIGPERHQSFAEADRAPSRRAAAARARRRETPFAPATVPGAIGMSWALTIDRFDPAAGAATGGNISARGVRFGHRLGRQARGLRGFAFLFLRILVGEDIGENLRRGAQRGIFQARRIRARDLGEQRFARIAGAGAVAGRRRDRNG